ncbi:MAG: HupE/UreJ family protein [Flavobacteriaceae bacterium]|nr:HupE/UreJ family protein [Flavobacteriaceae bacterium]
MSDFWLYFTLGLEHVLDWQAYDHVLFIIVLCAAYSLDSWRRLLLLVTLFTLGHTASLFLSNYDVVAVSSTWIEFLIPVSIITAAVYNLITASRAQRRRTSMVLYLVTIFFGLIHGFGFGRYFNQINDDKELLPLLEFALGIEVAQIIVVLFVVIIGMLVQYLFRFNKRDWILVISSVVIGMTIPMLIENWPF